MPQILLSHFWNELILSYSPVKQGKAHFSIAEKTEFINSWMFTAAHFTKTSKTYFGWVFVSCENVMNSSEWLCKILSKCYWTGLCSAKKKAFTLKKQYTDRSCSVYIHSRLNCSNISKIVAKTYEYTVSKIYKYSGGIHDFFKILLFLKK